MTTTFYALTVLYVQLIVDYAVSLTSAVARIPEARYSDESSSGICTNNTGGSAWCVCDSVMMSYVLMVRVFHKDCSPTIYSDKGASTAEEPRQARVVKVATLSNYIFEEAPADHPISESTNVPSSPPSQPQGPRDNLYDIRYLIFLRRLPIRLLELILCPTVA